MIAFFWLQRQTDILLRLTWAHYRGCPASDAPTGKPVFARIFHHKTGELIDLPLYDVDGTALWPELIERLDGAVRHGTLMITRDRTPQTAEGVSAMARRLLSSPRRRNPHRRRHRSRGHSGAAPRRQRRRRRRRSDGRPTPRIEWSPHDGSPATLRSSIETTAPRWRAQKVGCENEKGEFVGMSN